MPLRNRIAANSIEDVPMVRRTALYSVTPAGCYSAINIILAHQMQPDLINCHNLAKGREREREIVITYQKIDSIGKSEMNLFAHNNANHRRCRMIRTNALNHFSSISLPFFV